jgi:hypothetical protein
VAFRTTRQPYIMRLSCHKALPNRNVLPWRKERWLKMHVASWAAA